MDSGKDYGPFRVTPDFFKSDMDANEIRNIVSRIVSDYHNHISKGQDVGIITDLENRTYENNLRLAFHDLEEFGVEKNMHLGKGIDFFSKPKNLAEYVGGQILKLREDSTVTELDINNEKPSIEATNIEPGEPIPDLVRGLANQAGLIYAAREMLAIPDPDISDE